MSSSIKELFDYDLVKRCTKCGNISLKSNFYKNSKSKDGLYSWCKNCVIQKQKEYDFENRDKKRDYYNENRDLILNNRKNYRIENRNLILEQNKKYYNENRDLILDKRKNYYNENYNKIIKRQVEYQKYKRATDPNFKLGRKLKI